MRRLLVELCDLAGFTLCEIAFAADMRWGTKYLYRAGSRCYDWAFDLEEPPR